jgi:hypothetical protein
MWVGVFAANVSALHVVKMADGTSCDRMDVHEKEEQKKSPDCRGTFSQVGKNYFFLPAFLAAFFFGAAFFFAAAFFLGAAFLVAFFAMVFGF